MWTCAKCGERNALEFQRCETCGTTKSLDAWATGSKVPPSPSRASFVLLPHLSRFLGGAGWIVALVALLYAVGAGGVDPIQKGRFRADDLIDLVAGAAGVLLGLFTVATGEMMGVIFAIERNTRAAVGKTGVGSGTSASAGR